jgi:replicative DNA helicase
LISNIILSTLFKEKPFARKVLPHLKEEYFETIEKRKIYTNIKNYVIKYKNLPTPSSIKLELTRDEHMSEHLYESLNTELDALPGFYDTKQDLDWLVDETENWCKERALHNAIINSVNIIESKKPAGGIPEIIRQALQVEFDSSIGINFLEKEGIDTRWDLYQRKDVKIPTDIEPLDLVFGGGVEEKSLMLLLAGCVVKDSKVTLRNKNTKEVFEISIGEFFNLQMINRQ